MAHLIIQSAALVRYNANTSANNVGDCVKRAISLAFNLPYSKVSKELAKISNDYNAEVGGNFVDYSHRYVYSKFLESKGLPLRPTTIPLDEITTLDEFADTHTEGTYLVHTGHTKDNMRTSHIVCIIDGKIYDSWDSRKEYAKSYWVVEGVDHELGNDIDIQNYKYFIKEQTQELGLKYLKKYDLSDDVVDGPNIRAVITSAYNARVIYSFRIATDYREPKSYMFKIGITIPPTTKTDDIEKVIMQTLKVRMYDRFYEIGKQEQKARLAARAASNGRAMHPNLEEDWPYLSKLAKSFFNSLSPEVQPRVCDISVESPGRYSNSYEIWIADEDGQGMTRLYADRASELREIIDEFINTGEFTPR